MKYLDFEKPIQQLEEQISKLKSSKKSEDEDVIKQVQELETELKDKQSEVYFNISSWQKVQLSRHPDRPLCLDYIENITTSFLELHGDRNFGDDPAIVGGLAKIEEQSVMLIGIQKGRGMKDKQFRNFGMANPEGYRKALRLMKMAEKFQIPVVTLIDTPGASPGIGAEERGQAEAIARNLREMFRLKTPVLSIIIGEAAAGGALALSVADRILMLEHTWFSVIAPESCATILWKSWDYKEKATEQMKITAQDLLEFGLVEDIIPEPLGGAHKNPEFVYEKVKTAIVKNLKELIKKDCPDRRKCRIEKYSKTGFYDVVV
jgi:acetyl-CoA carboxylase carboxyl transferase subunit alpha